MASIFRFSVFVSIVSLTIFGLRQCSGQSTNGLPVARLDASESVAEKAVPETGALTQAAVQETDTPPKTRKKNESEQFMRIRKNAGGRPVALETSITRYELINEAGERITVDLIGVVHIGEKDYYKDLNQSFERYEGLLFELVAPEGTVIPKGGRGDAGAGLNPVAALQVGMQTVLGLEFQLDHIDYTKGNFVHADMSPEEFVESMKKNEESVSGYALKAIGQSMAMQSSGQSDSSFGMLMAMFSKDKEIKMRRAFARQMQEMEAGLVMFEGNDGSTIIDHRNAKCMEVLQREINSGKKNLAIFYGAGHLPDMQRRLLSEFKMKRAGQSWLTAWSLESK